MLVAARIAGVLLVFVLVTTTLSIAFIIQGGDEFAAGKCNLVVLKRKALQITGESGIRGSNMASDHNVRKMKKNGDVRAKYPKKSRIFRENYRARFVAFNADYRGPRHHPPKNN